MILWLLFLLILFILLIFYTVILGICFQLILSCNQKILVLVFCGNPIPYLKIGRGKNRVFYSASIHANESITTNILMKFIEDFCIAYSANTEIYGNSARNIFDYASIYIVPMCNPDGVNLVNGYYPTREPDLSARTKYCK